MGWKARSGRRVTAPRGGSLAASTTLALALVIVGLPPSPLAPSAASNVSEADVFRADTVDRSPTGAAPSGDFAQAEPGRELPSLRTRTSATKEQSDGSYRTSISSGSVNYRSNGAWKPIDNTLVESTAAGFSLENAANRYQLRLAGEPGPSDRGRS